MNSNSDSDLDMMDKISDRLWEAKHELDALMHQVENRIQHQVRRLNQAVVEDEPKAVIRQCRLNHCASVRHAKHIISDQDKLSEMIRRYAAPRATLSEHLRQAEHRIGAREHRSEKQIEPVT